MKHSDNEHITAQPIGYRRDADLVFTSAGDWGEALSAVADPNAGNPDSEAGDDNPEQRPITDNKAGG